MNREIIQTLQQLLQKSNASSQEALCTALQDQGFNVTQSTVSRLLKKLGAVKINNEKGESVYTLSPNIAPATVVQALKTLVLSINHNESLIVISTNVGAASLIAHVLDVYHPIDILGTIAGDDTIFIAPKSTKNISKVVADLRDFFKL
ncbi:MAG: arginine repressor [Gammaproteobacteria bacterium]|nr:arginine repressor [Gammaproteobacteria bacterium]